MRNRLFISMAVMACAGIAACSSPTEITTRDGQKTMSADRPEIDDKTGFVTYEKDGKEVQMNSSEIQSMEEVK